MRVTLLGAGNWGTTMALMLDRAQHEVTLWEFDAGQAQLLKETRRNDRFLPGYDIPARIQITSDLDAAVDGAEFCMIAVPTQHCRAVLQQIRQLDPVTLIISLVKGIEQKSLHLVSQICSESLDDFTAVQYAVISGPTIAPEVAAGLPTSAVVASNSLETATRIQRAFSSREFRLYTTDDVTGVELAGALKNVIALAAGICDGMGLGFNTKGALLTRGLAEMMRLGEALGGRRRTFSGLSGMGDLVTTCTSPHSRNRRVGEQIGRGEKLSDVFAGMVMVAEGVWTAKAASQLAEANRIATPITDAVCRILYNNQDPRDAVKDLMLRDLKPED